MSYGGWEITGCDDGLVDQFGQLRIGDVDEVVDITTGRVIARPNQDLRQLGYVRVEAPPQSRRQQVVVVQPRRPQQVFRPAPRVIAVAPSNYVYVSGTGEMPKKFVNRKGFYVASGTDVVTRLFHSSAQCAARGGNSVRSANTAELQRQRGRRLQEMDYCGSCCGRH